MKLFSRTALAAIAISFLATPMAQAQYRYQPYPPAHGQQYKPAKPGPAHGFKGREHRQKWQKGHRYSDWKKRAPVRDHHRYGLKRPARGQQWIKVDNDYLLVGIATGLILGIVAAR